MNFCEIKKADTANGIGIRVTLFVSGCTNRCPGCFQPETWDFNYGKAYTDDVEEKIIETLTPPYYNGLTILGGEPFELENQPAVLHLIERVKNELPEKTIWMYTGFTYDVDLAPGGKRYVDGVTDKILDNIDVLVDGRFVLEKKDITLRFRGSSNQRVIDVPKSRWTGTVVLSPYNN